MGHGGGLRVLPTRGCPACPLPPWDTQQEHLHQDPSSLGILASRPGSEAGHGPELGQDTRATAPCVGVMRAVHSFTHLLMLLQAGAVGEHVPMNVAQGLVETTFKAETRERGDRHTDTGLPRGSSPANACCVNE